MHFSQPVDTLFTCSLNLLVSISVSSGLVLFAALLKILRAARIGNITSFEKSVGTVPEAEPASRSAQICACPKKYSLRKSIMRSEFES